VWNSPRERICLEERRHGIVLARPFAKALGLGAFGAGLSWIGGPLTIPGALVLACAAFVAVRAAWAWESTRLVVTTEKLYVTYGFWRRRAAGVHLSRARTLEVEQTLLGRLLGYGTLIAGELEVDYVAGPWRVWQAAGGVAGGARRPRRPLPDDRVALAERQVAVDGRHGRRAHVREAHR
jgi:PH (Pleckstrin Homology) domain-containing protein